MCCISNTNEKQRCTFILYMNKKYCRVKLIYCKAAGFHCSSRRLYLFQTRLTWYTPPKPHTAPAGRWGSPPIFHTAWCSPKHSAWNSKYRMSTEMRTYLRTVTQCHHFRSILSSHMKPMLILYNHINKIHDNAASLLLLLVTGLKRSKVTT